MRILACAAAAAMTLLPSIASAADDDFIKGVYLSSEELCAKAKKETLQSVIEAGNVVLTANGIEGVEYTCEFVRITKANLAPAWFVDAVCQEPGYLFPDTLTIAQMNATQIDIASVKTADPEAGGNGGSYYLCDGVAPP